MSSILLVDDHAVVRNGLKQMLIEHLGSVVLGEANDAIEAMRAGSKARLGLWSYWISVCPAAVVSMY